ncbi:hypothetical protein A5906_13900 [Bradyrhizobium sacchari]|nr:hypothetical protein A5906_13900 [Bradyrhizobium sacchari]
MKDTGEHRQTLKPTRYETSIGVEHAVADILTSIAFPSRLPNDIPQSGKITSDTARLQIKLVEEPPRWTDRTQRQFDVTASAQWGAIVRIICVCRPGWFVVSR